MMGRKTTSMEYSFEVLISSIILSFWVGGFIITPSAQAQPKPNNSTYVFRTLAPMGHVPDIFYEHQGEPLTVLAGASFAGPYPCPENGMLTLYQRLPAEEEGMPPREVIVGEASFPTSGGPFILLLKPDVEKAQQGEAIALQSKVIDDSWEIHSLGSILVMNLSLRRVAVKIGEDVHELSPGGTHIFPYPETGSQARIQVAAWEVDEGNWRLRVSGPQVIYRQGRATFVLLDELPTLDRPDPKGLMLLNLVDTSQPPAS